MKGKANGSCAAQTVNVVKTLYPEMGGPDLKKQLLEVLKRNE